MDFASFLNSKHDGILIGKKIEIFSFPLWTIAFINAKIRYILIDGLLGLGSTYDRRFDD